MKAKNLLLVFLLSISMTGYCDTITISTSDSPFVFSPSSVTVSSTDVVRFIVGSIHNVIEVTTASGTTPVEGGFSVSPGQTKDLSLSAGTHYYICTFHISSGMRGSITVMVLGVNDFELSKNFSVCPNPATDAVNIKVNGTTVDFPYAVIDQGGRILSEGKLNDITTTVDLRQLNSGIYFLQVGDDKRQTFKLIKR